MIQRENPTLPEKAGTDVQFWTRQPGTKGGRDYWLNVATRTPQAEAPDLGRGGIIADGMGLGQLPATLQCKSKGGSDYQGKTLTTLSLVLATKKDTVGADFSKATLIGELSESLTR